MSLPLKLLQLYVPAFFKRRALRELFEATARAFGREMPPLKGLSFDQRLRQYATFTAQQAEEALRGEEVSALKARLRQNAYQLGAGLRKNFGITRMEEVMGLARILYRSIGIEFQGNPEGEITIRRCYFSHFYSPQVCQLISALDEGLLAGLAGGGRLSFSARISEGSPVCKACLAQRSPS